MDTPLGFIHTHNHHDSDIIDEILNRHVYEGHIEIKGNILDCGAYIGIFSKYALSKGCTVTAIEPDPESFKLLKLNAPKAKHIQAAITEKKKAFLIQRDKPYLNRLYETGVEVPTITLDELITEKIDLLKMDIEGAEYDALKSSKKLHLISQITMEYHMNLGEAITSYLTSKNFILKYKEGTGFGMMQFLTYSHG